MPNERKRVTARIDEDMYKQVEYWAARKQMTINEFIVYAIQKTVGLENGDYDLPKLEIQRLNQLIDTITTLSSDIGSLEDVVTHGFDSLLGLTRGDNYLLIEEDGEV